MTVGRISMPMPMYKQAELLLDLVSLQKLKRLEIRRWVCFRDMRIGDRFDYI